MNDARETLEKWATEMETRLSASHGSEKRYFDAAKKVGAIREVLAENERLRARIEAALALIDEHSTRGNIKEPAYDAVVKALKGHYWIYELEG